MGIEILYPRFLTRRLREAVEASPVVLIHGARQTGKTTLARTLGPTLGYDYITFDDMLTLEGARSDPEGFVARLPDRVILDEVQRAPEIFIALKRIVDFNRRPGRFVLTGSASVFHLPRLSDSLAGRMTILRLNPLAQGEIEGEEPTFLDDLHNGMPEAGRGRVDDAPAPYRGDRDLLTRIVEGGYPEAVRQTGIARREQWYRDYITTIVERDIAEMRNARSLRTIPRLFEVIAGQTSYVRNIADLAAPFELTRPTIEEYTTLLERAFLLDSLPPWHSNRLKNLTRRPKLHVGDTGLATALLGVDRSGLERDRGLLGQMVETFVYQEIHRITAWQERPPRLYHFRTQKGKEVDILLEWPDGRIAGIEVKGARGVRGGDFTGLRFLSEAVGDRFVMGVVLYDGTTATRFGDRLTAVPLSALWRRGQE